MSADYEEEKGQNLLNLVPADAAGCICERPGERKRTSDRTSLDVQILQNKGAR